MNSPSGRKPLFVAACFFLCHSGMGGTRAPDPYEEPDRYAGTLTRTNERPQEAVAYLKFSPPLWPFSLFSDEVSIEATIQTRPPSSAYFASLSAPGRVLALRPAQRLPTDSIDASQSPVPLRDKEEDCNVGELGDGRIQFRAGDVVFQGHYQPVFSGCGWRSFYGPSFSGPSPRGWYYIMLPNFAAALVGSVVGIMKEKRRGFALVPAAMRGAFIGLLFLPVLVLFLLVVLPMLAALVGSDLFERE